MHLGLTANVFVASCHSKHGVVEPASGVGLPLWQTLSNDTQISCFASGGVPLCVWGHAGRPQLQYSAGPPKYCPASLLAGNLATSAVVWCVLCCVVWCGVVCVVCCVVLCVVCCGVVLCCVVVLCCCVDLTYLPPPKATHLPAVCQCGCGRQVG